MKNVVLPFTLVACLVLTACSRYNNGTAIRLNQVGFAPEQEKTATIDVVSAKSKPCDVYILNAAGDTVWQGTASETMLNPVSRKYRQVVDFTSLKERGTFRICEHHRQEVISSRFQITDNPYRELTRKALRAFYYQRASMDILEPWAEGYARPAGHPDNRVLVHSSAATEERPEGTEIDSRGGWYDAGDYNKYIVNSGYTMGVWLLTYQLYEQYFDTLHLNIPESTLQVPDMLSEAMYNLRWMLTMQDADGGVYHKLTEPDFEGFIRPDQCQKPRYVVMKTTAATLDFAATMALAARVYAPYKETYPGFLEAATDAAKRAYAWAEQHPAIYYDQNAMNEEFAPAITTGAYDDTDVTDEFYWAATELYLTTCDERYKKPVKLRKKQIDTYRPAVWGDVQELGDMEWMLHPEEDDPHFAIDLKADLIMYLQPFIDEATHISVHRSPYGNRESDFFWGCNSEGCCWRGDEMLFAYHLTGDKRYLVNAQRCLNYILGQNATGYCYVTGFGSKPVKHPHHRLSFSHPKGTHPGFLCGGPNPMRQDAETDGVIYPDDVAADESYLDYQPSYASNEVTINWNVTLFALSGGLDAIGNPPANK